MTFRRSPPPRSKQYEGSGPTARTPAPRPPEDAGQAQCTPMAKSAPVRDREYRKWVASLDCAHCGKGGPSQAAHSDSDGKGWALKSSDLTCYPLCADVPGRPGCHSIIGSSGLFTRDQRRALETGYAHTTRELARAAGKLPETENG